MIPRIYFIHLCSLAAPHGGASLIMDGHAKAKKPPGFMSEASNVPPKHLRPSKPS